MPWALAKQVICLYKDTPISWSQRGNVFGVSAEYKYLNAAVTFGTPQVSAANEAKRIDMNTGYAFAFLQKIVARSLR